VAYFPVPGDPIDPSSLGLDRAREVAAALSWYPHAALVDVRRVTTAEKHYELLVIAFDVEVPQDTVYDIRANETLILTFERSDDKYPSVVALRDDFPHVPHLNRTASGEPKDLCIYEAPWSEVRLKWTGAGFLGDIARWLAMTAVGELHGEDQPLEPFLLGGTNVVVFPNNLFDEERQQTVYVANAIVEGTNAPYTLKLLELDDKAGPPPDRRLFCVTAVGKPTIQGAMHECPTNAFSLIRLLQRADIDLLSILVEQLKGIYDSTQPPGAEDGLIILVKLPRLRVEAGPIDTFEYWAFGMLPIKDVAIATGRYDAAKSGNSIVPLVIPQYDDALMQALLVEVFRPVQSIDRDAAKQLSGIDSDAEDLKIFLVGGGALGAQLHNHLSRMGWGRWALIDKDTVLPHNIVRHRLGEHAVGFAKALALKHMSDLETPYNALEQVFAEDVLSAASDSDVMNALVDADLILDISTSIAVSRFLACDVDCDSRRASMFLNPKGCDAVFLIEDDARSVSLDCLEAQYYGAVLSDDRLSDHIKRADHVRYSAGCRDVTARIGQDNVALFSGLLATQLRSVDAHAMAAIWQHASDGSIRRIELPNHPVLRLESEEWTFVVDTGVIERASVLRTQRLPTETGGVIVGYLDVTHRCVYVVDVLPAPPDSVEHRTAFVRGYTGLDERMKSISDRTGGQVGYIGEWHSHPEGADVKMSPHDEVLLATIADELQLDGQPGVMMIVGDAGTVACYTMHVDRTCG